YRPRAWRGGESAHGRDAALDRDGAAVHRLLPHGGCGPAPAATRAADRIRARLAAVPEQLSAECRDVRDSGAACRADLLPVAGDYVARELASRQGALPVDEPRGSGRRLRRAGARA